MSEGQRLLFWLLLPDRVWQFKCHVQKQLYKIDQFSRQFRCPFVKVMDGIRSALPNFMRPILDCAGDNALTGKVSDPFKDVLPFSPQVLGGHVKNGPTCGDHEYCAFSLVHHLLSLNEVALDFWRPSIVGGVSASFGVSRNNDEIVPKPLIKIGPVAALEFHADRHHVPLRQAHHEHDRSVAARTAGNCTALRQLRRGCPRAVPIAFAGPVPQRPRRARIRLSINSIADLPNIEIAKLRTMRAAVLNLENGHV